MKKIKSRKVKKKRKEKLKGVLFVLMGVFAFYCSSFVSAGEYDSVIDKNRVDNVYAVTNIEGRDRIFYLNMYKMNGRVSYCIDLGMDITTDIYHSTESFLFSNLSDEQVDYIRGISYFGYGYYNHGDNRYYMAAQELIWEYLSGVEVEWVSEMKVDGDRIDIEEYKGDILELKELYDRKLDLEWTNGQAYKVGKKVIIEDKNNMLSNYEVVSSKYSNVFIEDNNLVIEVGNVIGEERIELRKKGYYNYDSLLYYYDNSQRLISNGNYRNVDEVIEFNIEGVSLSATMINKNGTSYPLGEATFEGSIYELYDSNDNLIGTYKSNKNGAFTARGLVYGDYYLKHIAPSEGYLLVENDRHFSIDNGDKSIALKQFPITNYIDIRKVYGSNGNYKPERNVLFYVYDHTDYRMLNASTNGSGQLYLTLYYGTYRIHQVTTTSGYAKVDDFIIDVREHSEDSIHYNLVDDKIFVKVRVNTLDSLSGDEIKSEGFSYKVRRKDENTYLEYNGNDTFVTDNNGDLLIPVLLEYGDYVLEQVDVSEYYLLNKENIEFSINDKSKLEFIDDNLIMDIVVNNKLVMGEVKIISFLEEFYKELNNYGYVKKIRVGSEIDLISNEDIIVNGNVKYKKGEVINTGITNEEGELVFDNLYLGSYCLIDKDTSEEKCFELVPNGEEIVRERLEFNKVLIKKDIIINNLSSDRELLVGSVFELVDEDGLIINTGVTNDEGIIKIEDIVLGNYCVRQKKVIDGYKKVEDEICFLLEDDKILDIVNEKYVNEIINIPDTLKNDVGFYEAFVILLMIGTGYIVYKKIFNSKLYR